MFNLSQWTVIGTSEAPKNSTKEKKGKIGRPLVSAYHLATKKCQAEAYLWPANLVNYVNAVVLAVSGTPSITAMVRSKDPMFSTCI